MAHGPPLPGWSIPRPRPQSVASCLHSFAEEGPVTSRFLAWDRNRGTLWGNERAGPLSVKEENIMMGRSAKGRGGIAHRSVRWGRPVATILDHEGGGRGAPPSRHHGGGAPRQVLHVWPEY